MVNDAKAKGAKVVLGGSPADGVGYFFEPTVVTGVPKNARVMQEEIFGPVAPIASFPHRGRGPRDGQRNRVRSRRLRVHE